MAQLPMAVSLLALAAVLILPTTPAPPDGVRYVVSQERSVVRVHVGKTGLLAVAGHRHEVSAPVRGWITANASALGASFVELVFPTAQLRVLPDDEPAGDAARVEEVMRGPRLLEVARFGEVRFRSRSVTGLVAGASTAHPVYEVQVTGDLSIHGVTREVVVPMTVTLDGDTMSSKGRSTILHDQFGLTPVTAAGGTVRVRNEIEIDFEIIAEREH
jgi:polyisoprenoid-binding protein YceI